jgi:hypothetical protein
LKLRRARVKSDGRNQDKQSANGITVVSKGIT